MAAPSVPPNTKEIVIPVQTGIQGNLFHKEKLDVFLLNKATYKIKGRKLMFRIVLIGVIIYITGITAFETRSVSVTTKINSEEITISLVETAFPASDREFNAKKWPITVDGKRAYGLAPGTSVPISEISGFTLTWGGKKTALSKKLYNDIFQAYIDKKSMVLHSGIRESEVLLLLNGGDGGGVFSVLWILRKDGNHNRYAVHGGDCHLFDLYCAHE